MMRLVISHADPFLSRLPPPVCKSLFHFSTQHHSSLTNFCEPNLMPQLLFNLSEVDVSDAESIARHVEVPAMQNSPLYRTMFPRSDTMPEAQKEEITQWYINMLEDAFQDGQERFLKGYSVDGAPVGFCGWTVIERNRKAPVGANNGQADGPPKRKQKKGTWLPEAIDIDGWTALSRALRTERDRVLKSLDSICRKLITV